MVLKSTMRFKLIYRFNFKTTLAR